jgi:hypothetical protein
VRKARQRLGQRLLHAQQRRVAKVSGGLVGAEHPVDGGDLDAVDLQRQQQSGSAALECVGTSIARGGGRGGRKQ